MAIPAILTLAASQGTRAAVKKYGKKAVDDALKSKQGQKFKKKIVKKYGPRPKADTKEGRQAIVKRTNKIKKDTIKKQRAKKTSRSVGTKGIAVAGVVDVKKRRKQRGR